MFDIKPIQQKPDSELVAVFRQICDEREHVSEVSGTPLHYAFNPGMFFVFSHLHSRGSCQALRLSKDNIKLMTLEEHEFWEHNKQEIIDKVMRGNPGVQHWKPIVSAYIQLKPLCNKISKFS